MAATVEVREADITTLEVDAIANAANTRLLHGGGVAGAIARAGGPAINEESERVAPIGLGEAVATGAGELPSRWVIHAATMELGGPTSADIIRRATAAALATADELSAKSLALVAFGTGVGGFPVAEAAAIEVEEVRRHLDGGSGLELIVFCVRGDDARAAFEQALVAPRVTAAGATRPVVVAPDKFKGTLSAPEAAAAIGRGLVRAGFAAIDLLPVADGGEGTMDALATALRGRFVPAEATDPLGRPVSAAFVLAADGRVAVVEAAQASGLWRLAEFERDPVGSTSAGTGELIGAALDAGAREVIVGVGGSATTDGGRGALEALGARFTKRGADVTEVRRRLRGVRLTVACDVRSPLLGAGGAARVFGPQKGAAPEQVSELETRLRAWAALARRSVDRDPSDVPMAGAAGGLAGGLWAFAGAQLRAGAALVLELVGFDARARHSCMVVTGEGRLDEQTLAGKAVFEVSTRARQAGVPCYVVPGDDALDAFGKRLLNVEVEGAERGAGTPDQRIEEAARRLGRRLAPYLASASARTTAS